MADIEGCATGGINGGKGRKLLFQVKMTTGYNNEVKKVSKELTPSEAIQYISKVFPEWKDLSEDQVLVTNIS